jgi:hypothetical protein
MNVIESRQVAEVLQAAYVDHDPAAALESARALAKRTRRVLLQTGIRYVGPEQLTAPAADGDAPRCLYCGCTDERPCPGGCVWVPGPMDGGLCSRCAQELALIAAALGEAAKHEADSARAAQYRQLLAARYGDYLTQD